MRRSETLGHANLLTFPPSDLLSLHFLTLLFFKIFVFIRVHLWFPLSSFLFPVS